VRDQAWLGEGSGLVRGDIRFDDVRDQAWLSERIVLLRGDR